MPTAFSGSVWPRGRPARTEKLLVFAIVGDKCRYRRRFGVSQLRSSRARNDAIVFVGQPAQCDLILGILRQIALKRLYDQIGLGAIRGRQKPHPGPWQRSQAAAPKPKQACNYCLLYKASVHKDLDRLTPKALRILQTIERALKSGGLQGAARSGEFAGLYRLRVGNHRVIYARTGQDYLVLRIGQRRDVYRKGSPA
jgi:mRNA interferase RelE/StbE